MTRLRMYAAKKRAPRQHERCGLHPHGGESTHDCMQHERRCAYCGRALRVETCSGCGRFLSAYEMCEHGSRCERCAAFTVEYVARIAEPIALDIGEPGPELPTWYVCPRSGCAEVSPQPGFCVGCRADHARARVVRKWSEP